MAKPLGKQRNINRFAGIEEAEKRDQISAEWRSYWERHRKLEARAKALGFSQRELFWAALKLSMADEKGDPEPDRSRVRRALEADYPWLYERREGAA